MMAEIFPNEGLTLIYGGYPKGAAGPANTWLGLFTGYTASTVGSSIAVIASWSECANAGAYTRQTISSASWGTAATTQSGWGSGAAQVTFATATAVWGTVNGFFVANSATQAAGNVYFGANFDDVTAVVINTNDIIKVTPSWIYTG
jgi:hypothetical protein